MLTTNIKIDAEFAEIEQGKLLNRCGVESHYEDRWLEVDYLYEMLSSNVDEWYTLFNITAQESKQFDISEVYTIAAYGCNGVELFTDIQSAEDIIENR